MASADVTYAGGIVANANVAYVDNPAALLFDEPTAAETDSFDFEATLAELRGTENDLVETDIDESIDREDGEDRQIISSECPSFGSFNINSGTAIIFRSEDFPARAPEGSM